MIGNNMNGEINWNVCAFAWYEHQYDDYYYYCHENRVGRSTISNAVPSVLRVRLDFSPFCFSCFGFFRGPVVRFSLNCILFYFIIITIECNRWHAYCRFFIRPLCLFPSASRLSISIPHHLSLSINYCKLLFLLKVLKLLFRFYFWPVVQQLGHFIQLFKFTIDGDNLFQYAFISMFHRMHDSF